MFVPPAINTDLLLQRQLKWTRLWYTGRVLGAPRERFDLHSLLKNVKDRLNVLLYIIL